MEVLLIREVEKETSLRGDLEVFRDALQEWIFWAKEHGDNFDPIKKLSMLGESQSLQTESHPDHEMV